MIPEETKAQAKLMWHDFSARDRNLVRIGMFPCEKMTAAEKLGHNGKDLAVELMQCAKDNGGMVA